MIAQEKPPIEQGYNARNWALIPILRLRSRIFQQLDELKPLPYEQLQRGFPTTSPASREQKGLIFGGLIADGISGR